MSNTEVVIFERKGAVAEITFNRPHAYNAIDPQMACRLIEIFDDIALAIRSFEL